MRERWLKQTRRHDPAQGLRGDCARAAIASLLDKPLVDVPDFDPRDALTFYGAIEDYFTALGYELYLVTADVAFDALHLASGLSPRGTPHMVVRRGTTIVHDPHPDGGGVTAISCCWVPIPLDVSKWQMK